MPDILANRPPTPNSGGVGLGFMSPQNWGLGGRGLAQTTDPAPRDPLGERYR